MFARLARRYSTNVELFHVFTYGTLKTGFPNHDHLEIEGHSRLIGHGRTMSRFPLVIASRYNIPFLLNKPGCGHRIYGEVWEVDRFVRHGLDVLEGHPVHYRRTLHSVEVDGGCLCCWIYLLRSYPESIMQKPFYEEYTKEQARNFVFKEDRDPNIRALKDLDY